MTRLFHICSIVNDVPQYHEQRRTFTEAGFTDETCRFSLFDNSKSNLYDPYSTINKAIESTTEEFLIFCHQDIRLPATASHERLAAVLTELETVDQRWAICGNAGGTASHEIVQCLTDPYGVHDSAGLPKSVQSLDENFFVIRTRSGIRCSPCLRGFHLYATDLCLNAIATGRSAYVIDFHLEHLSRGKLDASFRAAEKSLRQTWNPRVLFRYVRSACTMMFLSRWWVLRFFFGERRVIKWLFDHPYALRIVNSFETPIRRTR